MVCNTNNKAATVFSNFVSAVNAHGLPLKVRGDQAVENVDVAWHMLTHPQRGSHSFISGTSCRNQRIERLWRDIYIGCLYIYYSLFYYLEDIELLDIDNPIHLFCLHYVYRLRINWHLQQFVLGWNNHPLRTARNQSPNQMWIGGLYEIARAIDLVGQQIRDQINSVNVSIYSLKKTSSIKFILKCLTYICAQPSIIMQ
jgi:hypothetical protein